MADFSCEAQAVLDAIQDVLDATAELTPRTGSVAAAALRATADQVAPEHRNNYPNTLDERYRKVSVFELRNQILAIATELEGHDAS
jgi:hypothetical protein